MAHGLKPSINPKITADVSNDTSFKFTFPTIGAFTDVSLSSFVSSS